VYIEKETHKNTRKPQQMKNYVGPLALSDTKTYGEAPMNKIMQHRHAKRSKD
jgi:hypothetical protein